MAKNKKDDEDIEFDLGMDEFFPLNDGFGDSKQSDGNAPPTFKSYTKNVIKSAGAGLVGVARAFLPAGVELVSELGIAKNTAAEAVRTKLEKSAEFIQKKSGGSSLGKIIKKAGTEFVSDIKKAATTGDFTFGTRDNDISFGDDNFDSDTTSTEKIVQTSRESAEKSTKVNIALGKSAMNQNTKLYLAGQASDMSRHMQSIGYIANIDSNVTKITKYFGTVGLDSVKAQMEYSEKSLALQQDSIQLLNMIKDQTFTPRNDENIDRSGGILSSIFGGGLDGEGWMSAVMKNVGSAVENSPLGALFSSLSTMDEMGEMSGGKKKTAGNRIMSAALGKIPDLLLTGESRIKLDSFNDLLTSLPGIANSKLNQMALTSKNPMLRMFGDFLGIKELSVKKIDLGVKDLSAKANFDQKFYKTVTDAIPGLLSKILASTNGQGEVFYDFKSGAFKTGEHAIRQYKHERASVYQSSFKLNDVRNTMTLNADKTIKEFNPDLSAEEVNEKSEILRKDIETITNNIASVNSLFDPATTLENKSYQELISKGVIDPNNVLLFIDIFRKLSGDDKKMFAAGTETVRQNLGTFSKRRLPEMVRESAGGSMIVDSITDEMIDEESRLIDYMDKGRHFDKDSIAQTAFKARKLKAHEDMKMKYGGRVNAIKAVDPTTIGEVSANGSAGSSQLSTLNNIYELLLGGILVYPRKNTPEHLLAKIEKYNEYKESFVKNEEARKIAMDFEDKEMRASHRELAIQKYKNKQMMRGAVGAVGNKLGLGKFKENFNNLIQKGTDKLEDVSFEAIYGKNEAKNKDILSFEDRIGSEVEAGSEKLLNNVDKLFGKAGQTDQSITSSVIVPRGADLEGNKIHKEDPFYEKIKKYLINTYGSISADAYGGKIDEEAFRKLIMDKVLTEYDENGNPILNLPKKKTISKINIDDSNSEGFFSNNGTQTIQKSNVIDKQQHSLISESNKYLKDINSTVNKIYSNLSKEKVKVSEPSIRPKDEKISNSKSIVNAIDRLRDTNKEFFDKILNSGMIDSINKLSIDMKGLFDNFNISILKMFENMPHISPEVMKDLKTKSGGLFSKVKNTTKYVVGNSFKISKELATKGFNTATNMMPGIGKGIGGIATGIGKGIGGIATGIGTMYSGLASGLGGVAKGAGGVISGLGSKIKEKLSKKKEAKIVKVDENGVIVPENDTVTTKKSNKNSLTSSLKTLLSGGISGFGGALTGLGSLFKGSGKGAGEIATGVGTSIKNTLGRIFNFGSKDTKNGESSDPADIQRREHMSTEDAVNELLHETTLIRHMLSNKRSGGSIVSKTFGVMKDVAGNIAKLPFKSAGNRISSLFNKGKEKLTETADIAKEKLNKSGIKQKLKGVVDSAKSITPSTNTKASISESREGSLLDQRKDAREEESLNAEITMKDTILKIYNLLSGKIIGKNNKKNKDESSKDDDKKKPGFFEKAGGFATAGALAGGAMLAGGVYQSTIGKSKLAEKTGLNRDGSTMDKVLSNTGIDGDSKYGFDGSELSLMDRSAQSTSFTHAPQAIMTAKGLYSGGKLINKKVFNGGKTAVNLLTKNKIANATGIPKLITGIFSKLFSNKLVSKIVSPKMATGIKAGLTKILKPSIFKGSGSKIMSKLGRLIGPVGIAMTVNDFITGMDSAPRYFSLGKGAKPNIVMRIVSGVVNVLSSFLFGLIPADIIVTTLYNILGSEEDKNYIRDFKEFTGEKAKILGVPSGPLAEFETKNFWQRMFKSDKRDGGTLGFGTDNEGFNKFKSWKDDKYKPIEELRQQISEEFGGDGVTGGIPSSEEEREKQRLYREKFLQFAREKVDYINSIMGSSDKPEEKLPDSTEKTDTATNSTGTTQAPTMINPSPTAKLGAAGAIGGAVGGAIGGNKSSEDGVDVGIPETTLDASGIKRGVNEADKINSAVGIQSTSALNSSSGAMGTVAAATGAIGGVSASNTKIQEPKKINKDDFKLTGGGEDEKGGAGSPVMTSMQNMTQSINTELDALRAIYMEQNRHNVISEEFYQNAITLMSMIVDTGKASFDIDKSRNEILAKSLLVELDPKYKKHLHKNTDTGDIINQENKERRENKNNSKPNNKQSGKGGFFGGNKSTTSNIPLGPAGSKTNVGNTNYDSGEKPSAGNEIDLTKYEKDAFSSNDNAPSMTEDELAKLIAAYKKENPAKTSVLGNGGNSKSLSDFVQSSIFGSKATHELYQSNIPVTYKGKRIGLKSIYIPKSNKEGVRAGDVIIETKFINNDKQYSIDNSGESTSSLNIDFSKGKFGKNAGSVILNINNSTSPQQNTQSTTAKMAKVVDSGGLLK